MDAAMIRAAIAGALLWSAPAMASDCSFDRGNTDKPSYEQVVRCLGDATKRVDDLKNLTNDMYVLIRSHEKRMNDLEKSLCIANRNYVVLVNKLAGLPDRQIQCGE